MAGQNLSPLAWTPTTTPKNVPGGQVDAGDWVQVCLGYRNTNSTGVVPTPGFFLVHVLYTPNSDDSTTHPDVSTIYGGSSANRQSVYRIDPGVAFQVPWNGNIQVVAGGNSDPATCVVDVLLRRGFAPRDQMALRQYIDAGLIPVFGPLLPQPPRLYAPPVIGTPQMVPATWGSVPLTTAIQFPDGAISIEAVDLTGIPGNPIELTLTALGTAARVNLASGIRAHVGPFGQGGATTDGVPATWQIAATGSPIGSATVWSSLGG